MATPPLILASASPRRLALLEQISVPVAAIIPANIDETPQRDELPTLYVNRMAREKAQHVAKDHPSSAILAADTIVVCGRRILPKADTIEQARECLLRLSGRRHRVYTAFALQLPDGRIIVKRVCSMVQFARLSDADMAWYLSTQEWQGKAGGYAIQGAAQALIIRLDGSQSNVVGLPLREVRQTLAAAKLL